MVSGNHTRKQINIPLFIVSFMENNLKTDYIRKWNLTNFNTSQNTTNFHNSQIYSLRKYN